MYIIIKGKCPVTRTIVLSMLQLYVNLLTSVPQYQGCGVLWFARVRVATSVAPSCIARM